MPVITTTAPHTGARKEPVHVRPAQCHCLAHPRSFRLLRGARAGGLKPGTGSPLVLDGSLLVLNGAGILIKASPANGDEAWKLRLKGPFSGSPVGAGHYVYLASERGDLQVVDTRAPEGEIVHTVALKDTILSTAALSGGALFVRSDKRLWKLN